MGYSTNTVANLRIILHKPPLTKQKGGGGGEEDKMHKGMWDLGRCF